MTTISANLQAVNARIALAAQAVGRSVGEITLLAVSKTIPPQGVREAVAAGQRSFGENYGQEAEPKVAALAGLGLMWHFIGPLQSNKTRWVAEHFDWVHSVERLKIAERLSQARPPSLAPLQVCIQVNISGEANKSGVTPTEVRELAFTIEKLPRLRLRGLMAIPEATNNLAVTRSRFALLRELMAQLNTELSDGKHPLDTLSMGMSHDLEAAILEGATIVRVGTAIFGERKKS